MTTTITFNVSSNNTTRKASFQVENKSLINCVFPEWNKNGTITEAQLKDLEKIANRSGDMRVLEQCDLGPNEKLQQAKMNNYQDAYDIKLSSDGKYFEITIKKTAWCYPDPRIEDIKKDFGLRSGVFMDNNEALVMDREDRDWDTESNHDYDTDKLKGGDTFRIPVNECNFTNGPAGFWRRLI